MKKFSFLFITILQIFIWNLVYWASYNWNWLKEIKDFSQDPKYEWYSNNAIFNEIFTMDGALCRLETINWKSALKKSGWAHHYIFSIVNGGRLTDFFGDCYEYGWKIQFTRSWEFFINSNIERKDWVYEKKWENFCEEELSFYNNLFWSLLSWWTYVYYPKMNTDWMYKSNIELIDRLWNVFLRECENQTYNMLNNDDKWPVTIDWTIEEWPVTIDWTIEEWPVTIDWTIEEWPVEESTLMLDKLKNTIRWKVTFLTLFFLSYC